MSGGGQRVKRGAIKLHKGGNQQDGSAAGEQEEVEEQGRAAEQAVRGEQQSLLLSKEQLAQLEQSNATLQTRLADVRAQRARALKDKQSLERAAEDLEGMLPKMALELEERSKQLKLVRAAAEELGKSVEAQGAAADGKQQLAALEKRHAAELKAHEQAQAKLAKLEAETADLHARIAEVGGPKLRAHKEELAQLEAAAEKTRKAISKQAAEVKAQAAKRDKAAAQEQEAGKEAQEAAARAEALTAEAKTLEDEALGVMQAFEQAKAAEQVSKDELAAAQAAAAELKGRSGKAEKAIVEMRNQLKDYDEHDIPKKKQAAAVLKTALAEAEQHWDLMLSKHGDEAAQALAEREEEEEEGQEGQAAERRPEEQAEGEEDREMLEGERAQQAAAPRKRPLLLEPEQLAQLDLGLVAVEVDRLEEAVNKLKKVVNMGAIKEYAAREKEYAARVVELDAVTAARDAAREECEALRKQRLTEFMAGFSTITLRLKEMYQMITLGGDAELELVDSCDPFSEGIVFSVRPPKKSWKQIALLSGGEKTLSSLALIFALHHFKPNALYCLDEVDAALDFKNVSIVANYIKERTQNAQFIVISLRNNMFELADRLVGIYKTHDATKSITISPALVVAAAAATAAQEKHEDKPQQHAVRRAPLQAIN
jgi:structural maintenance of chromosome 4